MTTYHPPVSELIKSGVIEGFDRPEQWLDYAAMYGIGREHIPELIRMAVDEDLWATEAERPEAWAPMHAWRALGQLRAEEAIDPLIGLFKKYDDWDYFHEDMFDVFPMIGPAALPALTAALAKYAHSYEVSLTAQTCIEKIGKAHPASQPRCIEIISKQLEHFRTNDEGLNGFLIATLMDFNAVEHAPLIERAFKADRVDEMVAGDWNEVQIEMGLKPPDEEYRLKQARIAHMTRLVERGQFAELGRNDPCWCGSGKKYKKCHLKEDRDQGW